MVIKSRVNLLYFVTIHYSIFPYGLIKNDENRGFHLSIVSICKRAGLIFPTLDVFAHFVIEYFY